MTFKESIAKKLQKNIKEKRYTITEVAENCGVSRQAMSRIVNYGAGRLDTIGKAYDFLKIKY